MGKVIWKNAKCPCCGQDKTDPKLKADAEALAASCSVDLICESGYRCKAHNEALKKRGLPASTTSRHLFGAALDLHSSNRAKLSPAKLWELAQELRKRGKFAFIKGIGRYNWGIHVDDKKRDFDYR